jgi:hypothetical protein
VPVVESSPESDPAPPDDAEKPPEDPALESLAKIAVPLLEPHAASTSNPELHTGRSDAFM